jgi:hypothetical protein
MNNQIINSQKIVIETNFYGEKKELMSPVTAIEKVVTIDDIVVYKQWQKSQLHTANTKVSDALNELDNQLFFRQQCQTTKKSRCNKRNFIERAFNKILKINPF